MAKRPSYPLEFRQTIIDLARAGRRPQELAAEFKISHQTVRTWLKQADLDAGRRGDGLTTEEREELLVTVPRVAGAGDLPGRGLQGGEQRGGTVAFVVVGHRPGPPGLHRQAGLGAIERLDL